MWAAAKSVAASAQSFPSATHLGGCRTEVKISGKPASRLAARVFIKRHIFVDNAFGRARR